MGNRVSETSNFTVRSSDRSWKDTRLAMVIGIQYNTFSSIRLSLSLSLELSVNNNTLLP